METKKKRGPKSKKNSEEKTIAKKRGRKPKLKEVVKIPKKRGRKPKLKKEKEIKVPKKRGRKPKNKSYGHIPLDTTSHPKEDENIIIHLPIKSINNTNHMSELLKYSPEISEPLPFDNEYSNYTNLKETNNIDSNNINILSEKVNADENETPIDKPESNKKTDIDTLLVCASHTDNWHQQPDLNELKKQRSVEIDNINKPIKLQSSMKCLLQMSEANKINYWPENTNICCWWCTYGFDTIPCALPKTCINKCFHVTGIFCSPECAAAYNFDSNESDMWERYALLNLMYKKIYKNKICLADPRQTLKKFGGHFTIAQFRENHSKNSVSSKIIMPPIKSIIPIHEYSDRDGGYSSKKKKNVIKTNSRYKLARSKPYNNNTLEQCMNIKT